MRNQFYYTIVQINEKEGDPKAIGSFSVDRVIRTVEYEAGKSVVLLDDFHEEQGKRPEQRPNGKVIMASFKESVYSSIYLNQEDSGRFRAMFEVNANVIQEIEE